ncbi:hypothetical protein [Oceanicoccus sp. KOV_DT_Chl]|uniref:hypothetical protein n=1 Tax=Oceanicoccus sp. KOV_DT_Chl TaxID=1904639 RepID=UPI000C7CC498|nr:hypothetical protein [Oceanicoccus sp. KOV_DT_Chl]
MKYLTILIALLLSSNVSADDKTIAAIIDQLQLQKEYEITIAAVPIATATPSVQENDGSFHSQLMIKLAKDSQKLDGQYLSWESFRPELVKAYKEIYTASELTEYLSLVKSSSFKKLIGKQQQIAERMSDIVRNRVSEYSEKKAKLAETAYQELEAYINEQEALNK